MYEQQHNRGRDRLILIVGRLDGPERCVTHRASSHDNPAYNFVVIVESDGLSARSGKFDRCAALP